jgi:hypothetical protein
MSLLDLSNESSALKPFQTSLQNPSQISNESSFSTSIVQGNSGNQGTSFVNFM